MLCVFCWLHSFELIFVGLLTVYLFDLLIVVLCVTFALLFWVLLGVTRLIVY